MSEGDGMLHFSAVLCMRKDLQQFLNWSEFGFVHLPLEVFSIPRPFLDTVPTLQSVGVAR